MRKHAMLFIAVSVLGVVRSWSSLVIALAIRSAPSVVGLLRRNE